MADLRVVDPVDEVLPAMQEDEPDMADPVVEALPEREEDEADAASPSEVLPAVELLELPEPPYEIDGGAYGIVFFVLYFFCTVLCHSS